MHKFARSALGRQEGAQALCDADSPRPPHNSRVISTALVWITSV